MTAVAIETDLRTSLDELARATRARRNSQMMTPIHWDHCWDYFCRKLKARSEMRGAAPIFG